MGIVCEVNTSWGLLCDGGSSDKLPLSIGDEWALYVR